MDQTDWKRIEELMHSAGGALQFGKLEMWQTADATSFHVLALAILDLNERLTAIAQLMDAATLASDQPPKSRIVVE